MAGLSRSTHDASATTVALSHVAADARGKRKRDRRSNAGPAVSPSALDGSAWAAVVSGCTTVKTSGLGRRSRGARALRRLKGEEWLCARKMPARWTSGAAARPHGPTAVPVTVN